MCLELLKKMQISHVLILEKNAKKTSQNKPNNDHLNRSKLLNASNVV
jgi:hypothetical protein